MPMPRKLATATVVVAAGTGLAVSGAPSAVATTVAGVQSAQVVHVVKDQAGGAYYNAGTGERFDVTATSIAPNLAMLAVRAADGVVLTETGVVLTPLGGATQNTPADSVVAVTETTGLAAYEDAVTGAKYAVSTVGADIPAANELALQTATGAIVTLNAKVLLPIEQVSGLNH